MAQQSLAIVRSGFVAFFVPYQKCVSRLCRAIFGVVRSGLLSAVNPKTRCGFGGLTIDKSEELTKKHDKKFSLSDDFANGASRHRRAVWVSGATSASRIQYTLCWCHSVRSFIKTWITLFRTSFINQSVCYMKLSSWATPHRIFINEAERS